MIHLLDMSQFNRRQAARRRHDAARRALAVAAYVALAAGLGVLIGRLAGFYL